MSNLPAGLEPKLPAVSQTFDGFERNLSDVIRARFSIVQIVTHEEDRARRIVEKTAVKLDYHLYLWSVTRGIVEDFDTDVNVGAHKNVLTDLKSAIDHCEKIAQTGRKSLFVFLDPRLRAEQFTRMREWANEHAINASERVPAAVGHGRRIDL